MAVPQQALRICSYAAARTRVFSQADEYACNPRSQSYGRHPRPTPRRPGTTSLHRPPSSLTNLANTKPHATNTRKSWKQTTQNRKRESPTCQSRRGSCATAQWEPRNSASRPAPTPEAPARETPGATHDRHQHQREEAPEQHEHGNARRNNTAGAQGWQAHLCGPQRLEPKWLQNGTTNRPMGAKRHKQNISCSSLLPLPVFTKP